MINVNIERIVIPVTNFIVSACNKLLQLRVVHEEET
jgi:hypothetical protein